MITLVPVSRFRVTYEVAAGRPFSQLERLMLRAIQDGAHIPGELEQLFQIHPRLITEGLVTLTHAGWLAVGGPAHRGFVLTSEGREAANSESTPSTIAVATRRTFVVLERLTGGLISNEDVWCVSRRELEDVWPDAVRLRARILDNRLDEGQIQSLLPRRQGEWVRWIGPIDMISKDAHWLPVNVDLESGESIGLPDEWRSRLHATIAADARSRADALSPEGRTRRWMSSGGRRIRHAPGEADPETPRIPAPGCPAFLGPDDILLSGTQHERLLATALDEAGSSVLIASAFATPAKLERLQPQLESALKRGVSVDILWGYLPERGDGPGPVVEWLKKCEYHARRNLPEGMLRFNRDPSGSHAKIILWDGPRGFQACVGSYNWLSAVVGGANDDLTRNVSVRLEDPPLWPRSPGALPPSGRTPTPRSFPARAIAGAASPLTWTGMPRSTSVPRPTRP